MSRLRMGRAGLTSAAAALLWMVGVEANGGAMALAGQPAPATLPPVSTPPPAAPVPAGPIAAPSLPALPPPTTHSGAPTLPEEGTQAPDPGGIATEPVVPPAPLVTADATRSESDHDAVIGRLGVEVRPVATTLPVFARRASTGCPLAPVAGPGDAPTTNSAAYGCPPVRVSSLGLRYWMTRHLAFNAGVALALGGGSQGDRLLDTYFGFGPGVGLSLVLGNWRHMTVAASPGLSFVWFKAAGSTDATYVADLRAEIEGEIHLGFIGLPALSLGIRSGVLLRLEKSADLSLWSTEITGATTLRGLVSDLTLRYYF